MPQFGIKKQYCIATHKDERSVAMRKRYASKAVACIATFSGNIVFCDCETRTVAFRRTDAGAGIVFVQKGKTHRADCGSSEGAGRGKRERTPAPHRKGALRNGVRGHPSETLPFLSGVRDPYT